jgi:hypothetical protein
MRSVVFLLLLSCAFAARAAAEPPPNRDVAAPRVEVQWAPTDRLSEVRDNPLHRGWLRPEQWMKELGDHLAARADRVLPPGRRLLVTIDDIKLAGDFEPWRGPGAQDVRVLRHAYPPRIDLHFRLLAADGAVLREGAAKLRDAAYLDRTVPASTDPLRYDKRLLDEWLRKEFGAAGPAG